MADSRTASTSCSCLSGPQALQALKAPQQHAQQVQHVPQLNWTHLKPVFFQKPEDDAEAHLLRMND